MNCVYHDQPITGCVGCIGRWDRALAEDVLQFTYGIEASTLRMALAEIDRLVVRQQELLAAIVRLSNETPFPDEIKGWFEQRAKLIAEVGTLRSKVRHLELEIERMHDPTGTRI